MKKQLVWLAVEVEEIAGERVEDTAARAVAELQARADEETADEFGQRLEWDGGDDDGEEGYVERDDLYDDYPYEFAEECAVMEGY